MTADQFQSKLSNPRCDSFIVRRPLEERGVLQPAAVISTMSAQESNRMGGYEKFADAKRCSAWSAFPGLYKGNVW